MRAVLQRVKKAELYIDNEQYCSIDKGIVLLIGIKSSDTEADIEYIRGKVINLRIFPGEKGIMDPSLLDLKHDIMLVSQFTLYGDCRKGRRPSYSEAMAVSDAEKFYKKICTHFLSLEEEGIRVVSGKFRAMMDVSLTNWGPVTLLLDSEKNAKK